MVRLTERGSIRHAMARRPQRRAFRGPQCSHARGVDLLPEHLPVQLPAPAAAARDDHPRRGRRAERQVLRFKPRPRANLHRGGRHRSHGGRGALPGRGDRPDADE